MHIGKWFAGEIPFFALLLFLLMGIYVEVVSRRPDLLTANIPLITLMIIYLVLKR
jgi:hypothetical protein